MFTGKIHIGDVDLYDTFELLAVDIGGGMTESPFGVSQSLVEEKSIYVDKPYFYGIDRQPISFTIHFARVHNQKWDYKTKSDFAKLIFSSYYQELRSEEYPEVSYKVICVDKANKILNGNDQGYISIQFRTDAPWAWGPTTMVQKVISGVSDDNPYTFKIENKSNVLDWYYPEIEIITAATDIKIVNDKDKDRPFQFDGLVNNEIVYINNQSKKIISDQPYPHNYRLEKFNRNWFRLRYGINNISVYRDCTVVFKMQYPIAL